MRNGKTQADGRGARWQRRGLGGATMALGVGFAVAAGAAPAAADPQAGLSLARIWCAECHVVETGQAGPVAEVATFAEVANRPDFSADRLAAFLAAPHPKMPGMGLSNREIADLGTYIESLRR